MKYLLELTSRGGVDLSGSSAVLLLLALLLGALCDRMLNSTGSLLPCLLLMASMVRMMPTHTRAVSERGANYLQILHMYLLFGLSRLLGKLAAPKL